MKPSRAMYLGAVVLLLGVAAWAQEFPRFELAGDYSFVRYAPSASYTQGHSLNGGGGAFKVNLNQYIGILADLQGYGSNKNDFTIPPNTLFPGGGHGTASGNLFTYLFGPQVKIRAHGIHPFGQLLFGAAHSNVYGNAFKQICQPAAGACSFKGAPAGDAFAMAFGGGADIPLGKRVEFRPAEIDYLLTRFTNQFANTNQNNFRYSGGFVFNFGIPPSIPPKAACTAGPSEVLPWAGPVTASVQPTDFHPKHSLNYSWNSNAGSISGQGSSATLDTTNLAPGDYTITANVTDPKQKKLNSASCSASFTVKQPQAPVVGCSATPSSVRPGDPITISVNGKSPDLSPIKNRNFSASAGSLKEGNTTVGSDPGQFTTVATLDTTNAPPGPLSVNVGVTDVHGFSGSCVATVSVVAPPPPPAPEVVSETLMSQCDFKNPKKLARVDNECKAVLDEVALRLQHEPNSKLVVVGYGQEDEDARVNNVEALRAANTKSYLTGGEAKQQIDPARIEVRESNARDSGQAAKFYLVPEGGTFTVKDTTVVDEGALPKDRTGRPKK